MTIEQLYQLYLLHPSIQTDTRKLKDGDIFFALKGPNFNGNLFAEKALELGAAYAIIDEQVGDSNDKLILVEDVLTTLQALAKYHRQQFTIPFIAITGSNGKTTTKELVSTVLASHYKTYTTQGNLNNHIGVPLTILSVGKDAEMAVIEMGANHQKEIASYCTYTLPDYGVITNCGKAHLEGFGGVAGVRKGKGELYDFLRSHDGLVFIFNDYDYLIDMSKGIAKRYTYSTNDGDIIGTPLQSEPYLKVALIKGIQTTIATQLVGDYNLPNVLCAVAIGKYFKVPDAKIVAAIENYAPSNSRSQMIEHNSNHIILDAYNANPTSMKAAIENFAKFPSTNKALILGGMMELGEESIAEHAAIVTLIKQYHWANVVLVGGDFGKIEHPFIYCKNATEAKGWFAEQAFNNAYLLIKGSRSMAMEKILQ
jgi:UDP-N-acetylmuramoyl-tripeptide--D-alanyl-D-alanine ligase